MQVVGGGAGGLFHPGGSWLNVGVPKPCLTEPFTTLCAGKDSKSSGCIYLHCGFQEHDALSLHNFETLSAGLAQTF